MSDSKQRRPGVMLAIMDVSPDLDDEFNRWYDEEHVPDKVGTIPGFLRARRYRMTEPGRLQYLCIYELEDLAVLEDSTYQGYLGERSEGTRKMKENAQTFVRLVYEQITDTIGIPLPEDA